MKPVSFLIVAYLLLALACSPTPSQTLPNPGPVPTPATPGQPPAPGQIPNNAILVGPAATRYIELLKAEDTLMVARYQIVLLVALSNLQAAMNVSNGGTPAPDTIQRLSQSVIDASNAYVKVETEYVAKYRVYPVKPGEVCTVTLIGQEIRCAEPAR